MIAERTRPDRCPGVTRPWPAADGPLVRVRVPGGRVPASSWRALAQASGAYGDGRLHLTSRANVQVRGVRDVEAFAGALESAGLLPSRAHDLVRNVLCSPLTGVVGGLADLRPVLADLDAAMIADDRLALLPGKFLVALDDGRGDVATLPHDLGAVVTGPTAALLVDGRVGRAVPVADIPKEIVRLMHQFLDVRGSAWHVRELPSGAAQFVPEATMFGMPPYVPPPAGGVAPGVRHVVPEGGELAAAPEQERAEDVVVTPWRSVLLMEESC